MTEYKTCTHIHDNGYLCQSAAVTGRDYCCYHLRYRGRQMRMAQYRARGGRFDLHLPPLENMHAVQSALSQLMEALAADMIDPRRAHEIHSILRSAATNFRHPEAWRASEYKNDQSAAYPDSYEGFEAEFGLPQGLGLSIPPDVAFPSGDTNNQVGCPVQAGFACAGGSPHNANPVGGSIPPSFGREPLFPDIPPPYVRDYMAEAEAAFFESTPEDMELHEILKEQGYKAMERRAHEHQRAADRKKQRKLFRANYARYAAEAKLKNIQRAAEQLLKRQAAEQAATQSEAALHAQPAAPLDSTHVPVVTAATRKPPASIDKVALEAAQEEQEAQSIG